MKSSSELKERILRRMEERQQKEEIPVEDAEYEEVPFDEISPEEIKEAEQEIDSLLHEDEMRSLLFGVEDQGFQSYVVGAQQEDNPYEAEEALAEAWNEGWYAAHVQTCTTNVLLAAKRLVEAASPEIAEEELKNLEEAMTIAKEVIDFEEAESFLSHVLEAGDATE